MLNSSHKPGANLSDLVLLESDIIIQSFNFTEQSGYYG